MNRIVRDAILCSKVINALGDAAEVFYRRLLNCHDDFGRFYADPALLRSHLYPARDSTRTADVARFRDKCAEAGAIALYDSGGSAYLVVLKVDPPRAKRSKFPQPPQGIYCWRVCGDSVVQRTQMSDEDNICAQMQTRSYSNSDSSSSGKREVRREEPSLFDCASTARPAASDRFLQMLKEGRRDR